MPRPSLFLLPLALILAGTPLVAQTMPQVVTVDPVVAVDGSKAGLTVRLSYPAAGRHLPIVILSHGNRLSREDYTPLVSALARAGYLVIQPDHADASVGGFTPPGAQPADTWRTRIAQVRWIAAHLPAVVRSVPGLAGRIDAGRIAVIGHSFGGQTAALAMGATIAQPGGGGDAVFGVPGLRAAVLLSPPGHEDGLTPEWKARAPYLKLDWRTMRGPVLIVTGGADATVMSGTGADWHKDAYRGAAEGRGVCLLTVAGAGHYLGGIDGPLRPPAGDATPERQGLVLGDVVSFLDMAMRPSEETAARWDAAKAGLVCK